LVGVVQFSKAMLIEHLACGFTGEVGGHRGRDRMVVDFITTNAISAYHN